MTRRRRFMIDLETLGVGTDAAILSIGACEFSLPHFHEEDFIEGTIGETFYVNVDLQSCLDLGMTVDASTFYWWLGQSKEAQEQLTARSSAQYHIAVALAALRKFLHSGLEDPADPIEVWAHGDVFDIAILNGAYKRLEVGTPWKYNAVRDARTTYDLTGVWPNASHEIGLTAHNALDDCKRQVRAVIDGWRIIERLRYDYMLLNHSKLFDIDFPKVG